MRKSSEVYKFLDRIETVCLKLHSLNIIKSKSKEEFFQEVFNLSPYCYKNWYRCGIKRQYYFLLDILEFIVSSENEELYKHICNLLSRKSAKRGLLDKNKESHRH